MQLNNKDTGQVIIIPGYKNITESGIAFLLYENGAVKNKNIGAKPQSIPVVTDFSQLASGSITVEDNILKCGYLALETIYKDFRLSADSKNWKFDSRENNDELYEEYRVSFPNIVKEKATKARANILDPLHDLGTVFHFANVNLNPDFYVVGDNYSMFYLKFILNTQEMPHLAILTSNIAKENGIVVENIND